MLFAARLGNTARRCSWWPPELVRQGPSFTSGLAHAFACSDFLAPEQLAIAYASADWLALPSTVETWGLVVAEALASGLPVIASCASGVGRFLEEEGAGFLVKEDTPAAWEAALMGACVFRDVQRLRKVARAASSHFVSWEEALIEDFMPAWTKAAEERN